MKMDKSMITKLEELVDNIKINGNVTRGCEKKMTVTPQLPSSCLVNAHGNSSIAALERSGSSEESGIASCNYRERRFSTKMRNQSQIKKTYSLISRNSSGCSNSHSLQGSESNSSKKRVYACKIPTRIKANNLSVEEIHKVIDKLLKNIKEVSSASCKEAMIRKKNVSKFIQNHIFDVSGKVERKTRSSEKIEKKLNKTYIKSRTPITKHGKYNVSSVVSRNNSPPSNQYSTNPYVSKMVSNESGLGISPTNSEKTASVKKYHKILEPKQNGIYRTPEINSLKNGSYNIGSIDKYDSKIVIPSLYTPEKYCTDGSRRGIKLFRKYPEEYMRNNNEEQTSKYSTFDYASFSHSKDNNINLLNIQMDRPSSSKIFHRMKNLKKFESTRIEYSEDLVTQKIPEHYTPRIFTECSTEEKNISNEKISILGSKKTLQEFVFCDDLPDVGTYEEFVAERLTEIDCVKVFHREYTSFENILVGTYEDFKGDLLNKDQKRLRGLIDSMFESGNIVMTRN